MIRKEKLRRHEKGVIQAAIQFFETEACQIDIKELEGSNSGAYPAEYMLLMERVDALRKFVVRNPRYHKYDDYKIQGEVGIFDKLTLKRMKKKEEEEAGIAHTDKVLSQHGYDPDEIRRLSKGGK